MKTKKRFLAFTMTTLLSLSLLSGCGTNQSAGSGNNPLDFSNTTLSCTITAVDDNVITLSLSGGMGGRQMMNGGNGQTPPDMPADSNDGQTPPDMPADSSDEQTSDTSADNTKTQKQFDNRSSTSFTLTITDESVLQDASLSDLTEGSMLTITFGDNNNITSITVTDTSNMSKEQ